MARREPQQYPWRAVSPGVRLKISSVHAHKAIRQVGIEGFRDIPRRVREVLDVSERVAETLEYAAHSGMGSGPRSNRVTAAEIVERVSRVNVAVRALAGASALTLSARYGEFAAEVEALLALVDEVLNRGVESDVSLLPSNVWRAFGPPP